MEYEDRKQNQEVDISNEVDNVIFSDRRNQSHLFVNQLKGVNFHDQGNEDIEDECECIDIPSPSASNITRNPKINRRQLSKDVLVLKSKLYELNKSSKQRVDEQAKEAEIDKKQKHHQSSNHSKILGINPTNTKSKENQSFFSQKLIYIRRFVNQLKLFNKLKKITSLKKEHLEIIGDISFFQMQRKNICKLSLEKILPPHDPNSMFQIIENIVDVILTIVHFVFFPLQIGFSSLIFHNNEVGLQNYDFHTWLDLVSLIFFFLHIFVKFNMSFYKEGNLIRKRKDISLNYMKLDFWIDLTIFTSFLIEILLPGNLLYFYFYSLFFIRIYQIREIIQKISNKFYLEEKFYTLYQLLRLIFLNLLVIHYFSLGFVVVANIEKKNEIVSWVQKFDLDDKEWYLQYLQSLYFSFMTMVTVGYGDIAPVNEFEKIYIIFMTLICCGVFAYSINFVGFVFQKSEHQQSEYRFLNKSIKFKAQKFDLFNFMRQRKLSPQLQTRAIMHLEYRIQIENENLDSEAGQKIIQYLPQQFREQLRSNIGLMVLQKNLIFQQYFSQQFLSKLSGQVHEKILSPGEQLMNNSDNANFLSYLNQGNLVQFITIGNDRIETKKQISNIIVLSYCKFYFSLNLFQQGQFLREYDFFIQQASKTSIISQDIAHIFYFSREDFLETLNSCPEDYVSTW